MRFNGSVTSPPIDLQALFATLGPRIEGLVDRAVARSKETLGAYTEISEQDIRDGILADLGRATEALLEGRPLTDEDRAGMGRIGDLRARQGVPLEQMLQVYRYTIDEMFNELWRAAEDGSIAHEQTVALTRQIWRYADPTMDLAISAYRARELQQAVADSQGRTALVHTLLLSPPGAAQVDPVLGAHLDPNATYVAIRARSEVGDVRQLLLDLQQPGALEGAAVAPYEGDVIGYALRRPTFRAPGGVVIGIGPAAPLAGLPHSFAIATRVVETAQAFGIDGVRSIDQLALQAVARTEDVLGEHLVARYVDPCEPATPAGEELLDTIRAVLQHDLSFDQAAAAMWVHPNTVRNRVRRYEQLTGGSLRSVDDLVAIRLALLRAELH